jgi:predicted ATPase/DNA-binding SARP family transcriptional activator
MLVLRANSTVPAADLIDGLWAADPPPSAVNLVQTYVSAWRKTVEPGRTSRGDRARLCRTGPGYRLRIEPGELDLDEFTKAVAEGEAAAATGDYQAGEARLKEALALWRGPPLADLAELPFQHAAAGLLEDLRLQAVEAWASAALQCGHARDVIAVIQREREREPLRERLCELLMWALFQDGRQAQALAAYEETRRVLADELGADPGPGLRDMQIRVLQHDPRLGPPAGPAPAHRLLVPPDSFVGRDTEVADVRKLIHGHRLVTLTGPGGCGKTRLAIEVAAVTAGREGREAFFVDAGPLADTALIPDRLAGVMGIRPAPGQTAADALAHAAADKELIVVLDNLEHLAGAAHVVAELLRIGPGLRLLTTSRASLHARGEYLYPVAPLAVPRLAAGPPEPAAAVELFADRATAADPAFELTADSGPVVAEICRRLDGLPLAIELAASRVRMLPPASLLARLDRRLDLLAETGGDRPRRQQTLRATIDWSYQLLDESTRRAFRALAVFCGGWSLPAAAVVQDQADDAALVSELAALVDASLIDPVRPIAGEPRFQMLETLRGFAWEQLNRCGEEHRYRNRHADYMHSLAAEAAPHLTGPQQVSYLDRLEADRDNLSSALRWLMATGQTGRGLRTAALLWRFWHLRAHLAEGRALLVALLARPAAELEPTVRADGLSALGSVAYWQRDNDSAQQSFKEALAIYREAGAAGGIALSHYNLGFTAVYAGDEMAARKNFRRALAEYKNSGDRPGESNALAGLALVDRVTGDYERGRQRAARSLTQQRLLGDEFGATNTLGLLGSITSRTGRVDEAEAMLRGALIRHERAGNVSGMLWMLHELAATAAARGQPVRAVMLSGAARSLEGELGGGIGVEVLRLTQPVQGAREQLDPAQAQRAWDRGRLMSRQQAVNAALSDVLSVSWARSVAGHAALSSARPGIKCRAYRTSRSRQAGRSAACRGLAGGGRRAGEGQSRGSVRGSPKPATRPRAAKRVIPQTCSPRSVSTTRLPTRQIGVQGSGR